MVLAAINSLISCFLLASYRILSNNQSNSQSSSWSRYDRIDRRMSLIIVLILIQIIESIRCLDRNQQNIRFDFDFNLNSRTDSLLFIHLLSRERVVHQLNVIYSCEFIIYHSCNQIHHSSCKARSLTNQVTCVSSVINLLIRTIRCLSK